jgi:hypothetical protein
VGGFGASIVLSKVLCRYRPELLGKEGNLMNRESSVYDTKNPSGRFHVAGVYKEGLYKGNVSIFSTSCRTLKVP